MISPPDQEGEADDDGDSNDSFYTARDSEEPRKVSDNRCQLVLQAGGGNFIAV
jgi:hypothetical protein